MNVLLYGVRSQAAPEHNKVADFVGEVFPAIVDVGVLDSCCMGRQHCVDLVLAEGQPHVLNEVKASDQVDSSLDCPHTNCALTTVCIPAQEDVVAVFRTSVRYFATATNSVPNDAVHCRDYRPALTVVLIRQESCLGYS